MYLPVESSRYCIKFHMFMIIAQSQYFEAYGLHNVPRVQKIMLSIVT